jgi:hypothetical protein
MEGLTDKCKSVTSPPPQLENKIQEFLQTKKTEHHSPMENKQYKKFAYQTLFADVSSTLANPT